MAESTIKIETRGDTGIVITREFNAPRELVFKAHTECQYLKRWMFGPDGWSLDLCQIDLRPGGAYRWVWKKNDAEMGAGGEYREVNGPARVVCSEKFDNAWYEGESVSTLDLEERDGRTTLVNSIEYVSQAARDAVIASPMKEGMEMGYARLDALFAEEAKAVGQGQ